MSESKQSLIDKLKSVIPGSIDDTIIDKAVSMVDGGQEKIDSAAHTSKDTVLAAAEKIKSAIPGGTDDKIIDNITDIFSGSDRNDFSK